MCRGACAVAHIDANTTNVQGYLEREGSGTAVHDETEGERPRSIFRRLRPAADPGNV